MTSEEKTREALAEVDTGQVVDQRLVQDWANSLSTGCPKPVPHSETRENAASRGSQPV